MDFEEGQSIFRCDSCNKPFDKSSTLKRHGYYCRSRKIGASGVTRLRSCTACASRKARCDNKHPECSRCASRAIECHYPVKPLMQERSKNPLDDHGPDEPSKWLSASTKLSSNNAGVKQSHFYGDLGFDNATDLSIPSFDTEFLDLESFDDSPVDLSLSYSTKSPCTPSLSKPLVMEPDLATATGKPLDVQYLRHKSYLSVPLQPSGIVRSLIQRPEIGPGRQWIAQLMLHNLKSYPLMMLRDNALPPHIHPQTVSSDVEDGDMEPLHNCISLMHMISSRTLGSRKLFWRNVRMECERLYSERSNLNKKTLLASMQALSVYILVRLEEGETEHNNLDSLLVTTVAVLAKHFNDMISDCTTESKSCGYSPGMRWGDWILQESVRRLCVIYQIVGMLIYFEPAAMCNVPAELLLAPLPAKKQLWEAKDEATWQIEMGQDSKFQKTFGLTANGELVKITDFRKYLTEDSLQHESLYSGLESGTEINWQEWCSGMDGFGGLVMLASSLLKQ